MSTHRFWRNVSTVLTGTAGAQAIPLLASLLIARLFAPAEFGVFASWLGVVSVAVVAVTGRFEIALALEADGTQRQLAVAGTLVAVFLGSLLLTVLTGALSLIGFVSADLGVLAVIAIPTILGMAMAQTWQLWASADAEFFALGMMRVVQAASITLMQILAGFVMPTSLGLAWAQLAGIVLALLFAWTRLPFHPKRLPPERAAMVRAFWRRHWRLPVFSLPADVLNTAAAQLPVVIVASRFGAEMAGLLALTIRALGAPIALLGAAVLDVFRRHAADAWRDRGECRAEYRQTFRVLALGSIAASFVIVSCGESLFAFAFGQPWRMAGQIAVWMMPMFALRFVASPLSYVFYVASKQYVDLFWQISLLTMTLATLSLVANFKGALIAYCTGYSLLYVIYLILSYRFSAGVRR